MYMYKLDYIKSNIYTCIDVVYIHTYTQFLNRRW